MAELEGLDLPHSVRDLVLRHQQNIADLVGRLHEFGLDDISIEAAVDPLIASYRSQLVEAMKALGFSNA